MTNRERLTMLRDAARMAYTYLTSVAADGRSPRYTVEPPAYVVRMLDRALRETTASKIRHEDPTPPLFPEAP